MCERYSLQRHPCVASAAGKRAEGEGEGGEGMRRREEVVEMRSEEGLREIGGGEGGG